MHTVSGGRQIPVFRGPRVNSGRVGLLKSSPPPTTLSTRTCRRRKFTTQLISYKNFSKQPRGRMQNLLQVIITECRAAFGFC